MINLILQSRNKHSRRQHKRTTGTFLSSHSYIFTLILPFILFLFSLSSLLWQWNKKNNIYVTSLSPSVYFTHYMYATSFHLASFSSSISSLLPFHCFRIHCSSLLVHFSRLSLLLLLLSLLFFHFPILFLSLLSSPLETYIKGQNKYTLL